MLKHTCILTHTSVHYINILLSWKTASSKSSTYITAPNRTVVFTISENHTEPPHRNISYFLKQHRTGP